MTHLSLSFPPRQSLQTAKGWYVKARGIFLGHPHHADAKDAKHDHHDEASGEHFLLSFSEKFDFKHRLVSHVDLHKEFAGTA